MKRQIIRGEGIQGITLHLSLADMFAVNQMLNVIEKVKASRAYIKEFEKTPYDERKAKFPEGRPSPVELSDDEIHKLGLLMMKMSMELSHSTIFEEDDENSDTWQVWTTLRVVHIRQSSLVCTFSVVTVKVRGLMMAWAETENILWAVT